MGITKMHPKQATMHQASHQASMPFDGSQERPIIPDIPAISLENGQVVTTLVSLVNDQGTATYLDLGGRQGARIRVADKAVLESGRLPDLEALSTTPLDEIHFLPEEPLLPQGYYDPTGCVPDALYERLISAAHAVESARQAYEDAQLQVGVAALAVVGACSDPITWEACIPALAALATAERNAYNARSRLEAAQREYDSIYSTIVNMLNECKGAGG